MTDHNYRSTDNIRDAGHKAEEKIHKVGKKVGDLGEKAADQGDELLDKSEKYKEKAVDYIQKHPLRSVVLASLAGVILGKIFRI